MTWDQLGWVWLVAVLVLALLAGMAALALRAGAGVLGFESHAGESSSS
jgi:hypothetical protein